MIAKLSQSFSVSVVDSLQVGDEHIDRQNDKACHERIQVKTSGPPCVISSYVER